MSSLNKNSSIGQYNILTAINYANQLDNYLPSSFLKKWIGWFGICLLLSFFLNIPAYAEDRALIIGIDKYQYIDGLPGCVTDANNIRQLVLNLNIYKSDQIRLLTDNQAKREDILGGLQWLVDGSRAGDKVLFYFSGHGSQQPDTNGDEDDKLDETLCPVDTSANRTNMVVDDEINNYLQKLSGRKVLVVIDSCHSGTITKSILSSNIKFKMPLFATPLPPTTKAIGSERLATPPTQGEVVVYTAVASNQFAVATPQGSIFTNAFINAIKQNNGKISNEEILAAVRKESEEVCQRRQSECLLGLTPQMDVGLVSLKEQPIFPIIIPYPLLSLKILPRETIKIGEIIAFEIKNLSGRDGYVTIWDVDSKGAVVRIFPDGNSGANNGFIQAGQLLTLPDIANKGDHFEFKAKEPKGKGISIAVLAGDESTAQQLRTLPMDADSLKKGIGSLSLSDSKNVTQEIAMLVKKKLATLASERENSIVSISYEVVD